jgi:hypothetical protein
VKVAVPEVAMRQPNLNGFARCVCGRLTALFDAQLVFGLFSPCFQAEDFFGDFGGAGGENGFAVAMGSPKLA